MSIIESMRRAPHGLIRRLGALGLGAMLAVSAFAPGSGAALAAPQASCTTVQCVITYGDNAIAVRQTALTTLGNKVTAQLNAGHITSAQAGVISNDVSTNSSGLAALKAKLDAETSILTAREDVKNIYLQFRIFAVVLPRDYHEIWLDLLINIDARLRAMQPKIDGIIDKLTALKDPDNDGDLAAINSAYADMKAQLMSVEGQIDGAQGLLPTLTPANYNADLALYKTNFTDFHNDIKTAHGDIVTAVKDLHRISQIAHDLIGEQNLPAGATPATEP
jgi:hypothetical protein